MVKSCSTENYLLLKTSLKLMPNHAAIHTHDFNNSCVLPKKGHCLLGGGGWKSMERPLHCCVAKATHPIRSPNLVGFQKTTQGKPTHGISPKRGCKTQTRLRAGTIGEPAPSPNSSSVAAGVPPERGTRRAEHRRVAGTRVPNRSPSAAHLHPLPAGTVLRSEHLTFLKAVLQMPAGSRLAA